MRMAWWSGLLVVGMGCGGTTTGGTDSSPGSQEQAVEGQHGQMTFALTPEGTPQQGANTFHLDLATTSGDAVAGAAISVSVVMPAMGHGSSHQPSVVDEGAGRYAIGNVVFTMAGTWEVTLEATAGASSDQATFTYEIE
ncbi:MAG: FixH family protein [Myxococcota bacterium]